MRAVIVNEYGGTPVVAEVPTPQPGPGQVLIKDGRLAGGHLTVDMTILRCTDIPDPTMNAHLVVHRMRCCRANARIL